jgi:hypothetical protein
MSNYRQTRYDTPFSGAGQSGIGLAMSDDFSNLRPQLLDDAGLPIPFFAQLDAKWLTLDPQGETTVGVDTRQQMAFIEKISPLEDGKGWSVVYQELPRIPAPGETVELTIYARCMIGSVSPVDPPPEFPAPTRIGLVTSADIESADERLYWVGASYFQAFSTMQAVAGYYVTFDGIGQDDATNQITALYYRMRTRQQCTGGNNFNADISFECSTTGSDWWPLFVESFDRETGPCILHVGFGINGTAQATRGLCDFFQVVEQPFNDADSAIGTTQQLGAV